MARIQLALNVDDLDEATAFYEKLFAVRPAKRRPGYANFSVDDPPLKLVLLQRRDQAGSLNHLGIEVDSTKTVDAEQGRLTSLGLATVDERAATCCYATQDKFWVQDVPGQAPWEIYTVLADSPTFHDNSAGRSSCCIPHRNSSHGGEAEPAPSATT